MPPSASCKQNSELSGGHHHFPGRLEIWMSTFLSFSITNSSPGSVDSTFCIILKNLHLSPSPLPLAGFKPLSFLAITNQPLICFLHFHLASSSTSLSSQRRLWKAQIWLCSEYKDTGLTSEATDMTVPGGVFKSRMGGAFTGGWTVIPTPGWSQQNLPMRWADYTGKHHHVAISASGLPITDRPSLSTYYVLGHVCSMGVVSLPRGENSFLLGENYLAITMFCGPPKLKPTQQYLIP